MLLNRNEFYVVNNPLRSFIQERYEFKKIEKLLKLDPNLKILEIGCGNGAGSRIILKHFKPKSIHAIDLDPKMIGIAKRKNKSENIHFSVGDATTLKFRKDQFDAIFDFGIIHHIPNWKDSIKEMKRVLKRRGIILIEDLSIETFSTPGGRIYRKIFDHPYDQMYNLEEFTKNLKKNGFRIMALEQYNPLGLIKFFVLVASKT